MMPFWQKMITYKGPAHEYLLVSLLIWNKLLPLEKKCSREWDSCWTTGRNGKEKTIGRWIETIGGAMATYEFRDDRLRKR